MSMETLKQSGVQENVQEKGKETLKLTREQYEKQFAEHKAKNLCDDILSQVGKQGMTPEKMKNYIEVDLPNLLIGQPTSVLESLKKQMENNFEKSDEKTYGAKIIECIEEELDAFDRSWTDREKWNSDSEKPGFNDPSRKSKFYLFHMAQTKEKLLNWLEGNNIRLKKLNQNRNEVTEKLISFISYTNKMIKSIIDYKNSLNTTENASHKFECNILSGIINTDNKACKTKITKISADIASMETVPKEELTQKPTFTIIQERIEGYEEAAQKIESNFKEYGQPADLVMSPTEFVKEIKEAKNKL